LLPNFPVLGPKLGKRVPLVKKALAAADGGALAREHGEKGAITIALPDGEVRLGPEDVEIRLTAKEDFAAAAERGRVLVVDTRLADALVREGLAREAINRIQRARKEMDLPFEARIGVRYEAGDRLGRAL